MKSGNIKREDNISIKKKKLNDYKYLKNKEKLSKLFKNKNKNELKLYLKEIKKIDIDKKIYSLIEYILGEIKKPLFSFNHIKFNKKEYTIFPYTFFL